VARERHVAKGPGWWIASDGSGIHLNPQPRSTHPLSPEPEPRPEAGAAIPIRRGRIFAAGVDATVDRRPGPLSDHGPPSPRRPAPASRWLGRDMPTSPAPGAGPEEETDDPPSDIVRSTWPSPPMIPTVVTAVEDPASVPSTP